MNKERDASFNQSDDDNSMVIKDGIFTWRTVLTVVAMRFHPEILRKESLKVNWPR